MFRSVSRPVGGPFRGPVSPTLVRSVTRPVAGPASPVGGPICTVAGAGRDFFSTLVSVQEVGSGLGSVFTLGLRLGLSWIGTIAWMNILDRNNSVDEYLRPEQARKKFRRTVSGPVNGPECTVWSEQLSGLWYYQWSRLYGRWPGVYSHSSFMWWTSDTMGHV